MVWVLEGFVRLNRGFGMVKEASKHLVKALRLKAVGFSAWVRAQGMLHTMWTCRKYPL